MSIEELLRNSVLQYVADESDRQAYSVYLGYKDRCTMLSFEEAKKTVEMSCLNRLRSRFDHSREWSFSSIQKEAIL